MESSKQTKSPGTQINCTDTTIHNLKTFEFHFDKPKAKRSFPNALPWRKYTEPKKHSTKDNHLASQRSSHQAELQRTSSLPVQLKQLIIRNSSRGPSHEKPSQSQQRHLKQLYNPKLKYKTRRIVQTHRTNTIHSESQFNISQPTIEKKLTTILFGPSVLSNEQEREHANSPSIYMMTAQGKRQKVDGTMYMKKIKAKCSFKLKNLTLVTGQAPSRKAQTQRQLYIQKDHEKEKKSYLTTYTSFCNKRPKKMKTENQTRQNFLKTCRPWSPAHSQRLQ